MLPIGYSKVTIDATTKTRYRAVELDHLEDEVRKTLGENLGCQVLVVINDQIRLPTKVQKEEKLAILNTYAFTIKQVPHVSVFWTSGSSTNE